MYSRCSEDLVAAYGLERQRAVDVGLGQDALGERVFDRMPAEPAAPSGPSGTVQDQLVVGLGWSTPST
jgi:hypothetical protein